MATKLTAARLQFNTGLISPEAQARTDLQQNEYACRQLLNMTPNVIGSVSRRGGSLYVHAAAKTEEQSLPPLLIGFVASPTNAYVLELTAYRLRVYKNHEIVKNDDGSIYEIATPYTQQDLFAQDGSPLINHIQVNDVMYLAHEKYPLHKLCCYADRDFRLERVVLNEGPFGRENTHENKILSASAQGAEVTISAQLTASCCQETPITPVHNLGAFGKISVWQGDKKLAETNSYAAEGENVNATLASLINGANIGMAVESTDNYQSFTLTDVSTDKIYADTTITLQLSYTDESIAPTQVYLTFNQVTTDLDIFTPQDVGRQIRLTAQNKDTQYWYAGRENVKKGDILKSEGKFYQAQADGSCGSIKPQHTEGSENDGKISWKYLHSGYGWATITKYISASQVQVLVHGAFPEGISTYKWQMGIIGQNGIYPHLVFYFKDRLGLGINTPDGMNICFSKTGDYENFADMDFGEITADCAFSMTILTELCMLSFVKESEMLYVGTQGQILQIRPMSSGEVFGPENVAYDVIAPVGAKMLPPINIGGSMLFLGIKGKDIYDLGYSADSETYDPSEVSLLAKEYLSQGICAWALQYEPNRVVWCLRRDGKLLGLTYNKSQMVHAFHLHETDGKYTSLAVIPSPDGKSDELWTAVKRGENYLVEYFPADAAQDMALDLTEEEKAVYLRRYACFLDSARQFVFDEPVRQVQGLHWLAGKEVLVLADGKEICGKRVGEQDLTLHLDTPAKVICVGLAYKSVLEPTSAVAAQSCRINQVLVRLLNSGSFTYGDGEVKDEKDLSAGETLKTGDVRIYPPCSQTYPHIETTDLVNSTAARLVLQTDGALPLNVLGLFMQMEVSEN